MNLTLYSQDVHHKTVLFLFFCFSFSLSLSLFLFNLLNASSRVLPVLLTFYFAMGKFDCMWNVIWYFNQVTLFVLCD